MDVTNEFEASYSENAHRLAITLQPAERSEIAVEGSKLTYHQTVVWLGSVTDQIRDIPGVQSAYPRSDKIYFTVAKENQDEFSRILDNVFAVIGTALDTATDRTEKRLEELSAYTLVRNERESEQ